MSSSKIFLKGVILGDYATGRTTIRDYIVGAHPDTEFIMGIGADFVIHERNIDSKLYHIQLWDLAGGPKPNQVRSLYFKAARFGIVVFDVSNRQSFYSILNWIEELWTKNGFGPVPTMIVANKCDLRTESSVPQELTQQIVAQLSQRTTDRGFSVNIVESSKIDRRSLDMGLQLLWQDAAKFLETPYSKLKLG